jgi:glucose/arabinose dehydrogenase
MFLYRNGRLVLSTYNLNDKVTSRKLNPSDIYIQQGYSIEVFANGLDSPIGMTFNDDGEMFIAESGFVDGNARILKLVNNNFELIADNFNVPISGISYLGGAIYVSHRGYVTKIYKDGTRQNIIMGLPSNGDHYNSPVCFSPDNKLYFGQGTVTNSGVVGNDNIWLTTSPLLCDYPGDYIMLYGQNYETANILTEELPDDTAITGAFSPYGISNLPFETRKKYIKASGSILRSNLDGSNLEQVAWGFRNPSFLKFDISGQLFAGNNGYTAVGSRPIENATDDFYYVNPGVWYGWPDFSGGEAVSLPRFRPNGGNQPDLLLKNQPNIPPKPFVSFPSNSNIRGFDFNYNRNFGPYGDVYIAEYGSTVRTRLGEPISYAGAGHRISRIDMKSRTVSTFAINKSGFPASISKEGGFERPTYLVFGPDGNMYIVDSGINIINDPDSYEPGTGVIWKVVNIKNDI